jgi:drug/metabolite transporter (DMT)-like permease
VGVAGDFFIKLAGAGKKYIELRWFFVGFCIYAATAFGWFFVMKHLKLSTLGVVYAISTVLFITAVGVFYYKESLSAYEMIGIVLGITSLVLMAKFA